MVPEDHTEDIRRFSRELRIQQGGGSARRTPDWRRLSPSAELPSIPNTKHVASSETPAYVEQTAFVGASSPRTGLILSRRGTPEGLHGGVRWPRRLSAPLSRTGEQSGRPSGLG